MSDNVLWFCNSPLCRSVLCAIRTKCIKWTHDREVVALHYCACFFFPSKYACGSDLDKIWYSSSALTLRNEGSFGPLVEHKSCFTWIRKWTLSIFSHKNKIYRTWDNRCQYDLQLLFEAFFDVCVALYLHSPNTPSWRGAYLSTGTTTLPLHYWLAVDTYRPFGPPLQLIHITSGAWGLICICYYLYQ